MPAPASATPPAPVDPKVKGQALFLKYCALCHGKDAKGYAADNAPSLVNRSFLESATDAFLASSIQAGRPGTAMGAYGKNRGGPLDDADVAALVAFLRAQGPAPQPLPSSPATGNALHGQAVYRAHCARCHGTEKERKTALSLYNPELLVTASRAFLRYAIVNGRPPTPMPSFAKTLKPSDIDDVLAWIESKRPVEAEPPPSPSEIPKNLPIVLNPKGKPPAFTLRDERFVPADEVKKALAEKRRFVIVDARSPADWVEFHIPGAISVPYYEHKELERIPNDGTWVIAYCACPHHASGEVVDALRSMGYKHTAVMDEGILVWRSRGYPLAGRMKQ